MSVLWEYTQWRHSSMTLNGNHYSFKKAFINLQYFCITKTVTEALLAFVDGRNDSNIKLGPRFLARNYKYNETAGMPDVVPDNTPGGEKTNKPAAVTVAPDQSSATGMLRARLNCVMVEIEMCSTILPFYSAGT